MHGEGCEEGEGSQEEGIRGCQSSIKNTSHLESAFLVPTIASQARHSVSATSSSSWIGRPQPAAGPSRTPSRCICSCSSHQWIAGLPIQLLVELVELTEDQSTRAEEHREHRPLRQDTGREKSFLSLTRSNRFTMKFTAPSRKKYMKYTTSNVGLADADTAGGC